MTYPRHEVVKTAFPAPETLRRMGRAANEAANTFAMREWASRLATLARPRDYVGQLKRIYLGVLDRWRYVQEPDEWIHGSARSLIDHVLGAKYNTPPGTDARMVPLSRVPSRHKGWGDCDDVSTVVAAAARAIGMTPYFRVARGNSGAHVSVIVRTPSGKLVSVDPVGHPTHPFGWALPADQIEVFDMDANHVSPVQVMSGTTSFSGVNAMAGDMDSTYLTNYYGRIEGRIPRMWTAVPRGDRLGARALAVSRRYIPFVRRGVVWTGMTGVDEYGRGYVYDAERDLWISQGLMRSNLRGFGDLSGGLGRLSERARRRRAKRRRVIKRIVQRVRGGLAKVLNSKIAQGIVGTALQAVGLPSAASRAFMSVAGNILKQGGIPALVRLIRKNPKQAARMVAAAAKGGLKAAVGLSGPEDTGVGEGYIMTQGGRRFSVQPVCALAGVPSLYGFGDLEIAATPTPGKWYRVKRGDTLYKVTRAAYGTTGGANVERARWMNAVKANEYGFDPTLTDNLLKGGRLSFNPKFAANAEDAIRGVPGSSYPVYYIPMAPGDEPPAITPEEQIPPATEIPPETIPPIEPEIPPAQDEDPLPPADEIPPATEDLPPIEPETPGTTIPPVDTTPPHIPPTQIPPVEIEPEIIPPSKPQIPPVDTTPQIPPVEIEPEILPPHIPPMVIPPSKPQIPPTQPAGALPLGLLAFLVLSGEI